MGTSITLAIIIALSVVGCLHVSSCSNERQEEQTIASASPKKPDLIVVLNASGKEIIKVKKKDSEKYKITISEKTYKSKVSRGEPAEDRIKVKDDENNILIKVKRMPFKQEQHNEPGKYYDVYDMENPSFKVTDRKGNTIIKFKPSGAGYKIKDDNDNITKIKPKGDRFVVTSDAGSELGSVEADGESWRVLDSNGSLLYTVHGVQGKAAAVLLVLRDNELAQAAVLIYLNEF